MTTFTPQTKHPATTTNAVKHPETTSTTISFLLLQTGSVLLTQTAANILITGTATSGGGIWSNLTKHG